MPFTRTTVTYARFPANADAKFTCTACLKSGRTRTFRVECTMNPFNRTPEGRCLSAFEVRRQAMAEAVAQRDLFMQKPLCRSCEDKLDMRARLQLRDDRKALASATPTAQPKESQ